VHFNTIPRTAAAAAAAAAAVAAAAAATTAPLPLSLSLAPSPTLALYHLEGGRKRDGSCCDFYSASPLTPETATPIGRGT
jgi:hypothetical protein